MIRNVGMWRSAISTNSRSASEGDPTRGLPTSLLTLRVGKFVLTQFLAIGLLSVIANGEDTAKKDVDVSAVKTPSPLRKVMDESISWNEFFADEQSATPMTARVVMRWANNTRGSEDGMTVLFLNAGRPEAVCCMYPWMNSLHHEFDSLSRGKLIAKRDGIVVWAPEKPGVTFLTVPDADLPAENPAGRMRQMKTLAAQFSSTMLGWRADKSDREELRLLPQPLYRYESKRSDLVDGAVFAFVQGTDPESLLLLEAIKTTDRTQWQFAFARRTSGELEGRHKDKVVWHADRFPENGDPKSTHRALGRPLDPSLIEALK